MCLLCTYENLDFLLCIYYVAFENFKIQLATQKNLVIFMCAFFVLVCGLSIFLKNEAP